MSYYASRTDGELVDLAMGGDRAARRALVDRTLLPASRVATHLEPDADAAVGALVAAYREAFTRIGEVADHGQFLPVLLARLDHRAPFPLDPATHAPLAPVDRDRVRRAVAGDGARRRGVPLAAALLAAAAIGIAAIVVGAPSDGVRVDPEPGGAAPTTSTSPDDDTPPRTETAPATDDTADDDTAGDDAAGDDADQGGATTPPPSDATPEPSPSTSVSDDEVFDGGTGTGELAETR